MRVSTSDSSTVSATLDSRVMQSLNECVHPPVSHHGISSEVISGALSAAKRYFELPVSEKLKVRSLFSALSSIVLTLNLSYQLDIHKSDNYKGYTALFGENTDVNGLGDLHEGFDLGWEPESTSEKHEHAPSVDDSEMGGGNVWPDLAGNSFKDPVLAY